MVEHALRYPEEELYNIIIEGVIEEKRTAGRLCISYIGQIKNEARAKTFRELKEKANNRLEQRVVVVDQPTG